MPRSATKDILRQSFRRKYSSEEMEDGIKEHFSINSEVSGEAPDESTVRKGPKRWSVVVLSAVGSAAAVAAVGCFCALVYPILKELRTERVRGQDGTEERMLGFWSMLVLSVFIGCVCFTFSWTLIYLDSYKPGMAFLSIKRAQCRDTPGHDFHMGYGVAVLNGIMGLLTVIWSLT